MLAPADMTALLGLLYEAAVSPDVWPPFLSTLAGAVAAVCPGLFVTTRATDQTLWSVTVGHDPAWTRAYETHFRQCDPRRRRMAVLPAGEVFVGSAILPDRELVRSEFYNDFLHPQGLFHIAGAVPLQDGERCAVVRVLRPRSRPAFDRRQLDLLRELTPHVSQALRIGDQLAAAEARRAETAELLDWFPSGVILLDAGGRIVATNRMADAILTAGDGLRAGRDGLRAAVPAEAAALQRLLAGATVPGVPEGVLNVTRRPPARPLSLLVSPLRGGDLRRAVPRGAVVVFVTDPDRVQYPPVDHLQHWLGLTRAEATLVLELLRGRCVEEAAVALDISVHTARTQLKRALAKTGTGRQAELLRLALTTPATLAR